MLLGFRVRGSPGRRPRSSHRLILRFNVVHDYKEGLLTILTVVKGLFT